MIFQEEKAFQMEESAGTKIWGKKAKCYGEQTAMSRTVIMERRS
jgi:hypothetical protein